MVQFGPEYDLASRIKRIEDWIARQHANPLGQAFSVTQSDGSVGMSMGQNGLGAGAAALQFFQGPNTSRDPNTNQHPLMLYIGQLVVGGTAQDNGMLMYYPNGTQLFALGQDGLEFRDPNGSIVVSNDQASHEGLARPWIPLPNPAPTAFALWPHITSSGLIAECFFNAQHPKVYWNASVAADSGVTGTVQATLSVNGQQVQSSTYTYSGTQVNISETMTLPQPFFGLGATFEINGTITGGTGNLYCQTWELMGQQS